MDASMQRQQAVASTSGRCQQQQQQARAPVRPRASSRRALRVASSVYNNFKPWHQGALPEGFKPDAVVPGVRTVVTPRLDPQRVFERMLRSPGELAAAHHAAFYSSLLGGITMEPGLMAMPAADHLVHSGHGVYDVIPLTGGQLYQLDEHLSRLAAAAEDAGIAPPLAPPQLRRAVLDTAAASMKLNGHVKVWLSPGPGDFELSTAGCTEAAAYALVTTEWALPSTYIDRTAGWRGTVSPVEPPAEYFGAFKHVSRMQAAVAKLEAEGRGYDQGLFVDAAGHVLGAGIHSLAIIDAAGAFVYPPPGGAPRGITVETLAKSIIPERADVDLSVTAIEQRPIALDDLLAAREAMLVSSVYGVVGLTCVDETLIGDGAPGVITLACHEALTLDRERADSSRHTRVPYGALTGMPSQLV